MALQGKCFSVHELDITIQYQAVKVSTGVVNTPRKLNIFLEL